tara:strand:+ start:4623 stop:4874 length:252 start_codon:yes stop_codon:yes gene_type:complete
MEGWDFFEPQSGEDRPPEKQDIDILISKTFGSEEGRKVLAWLRSMTIEAPAWVPGQDASYGYAREGQNSLVRELERRIVRARA